MKAEGMKKKKQSVESLTAFYSIYSAVQRKSLE